MDFQNVLGLKGLKIVHLNCRSILNKVNEIDHVFKGSDILTCSETWLSSAVPNHLVSIPAMDLYRYDRDMGVGNGIKSLRGGGVACYIRKDLNLNTSICPEYTRVCCNIEIMTLKCIHDFGKIMHILTIYRPPRGSCDEFFNILSSFVELGNLLNYDLYICGDFKIDYLHRNDIKTKMLFTNVWPKAAYYFSNACDRFF